jgi:hypothetical protein|tara:strand:+ start:257 stop:754 length:498 start_codon:yes stop_codon:yes gene_type:complete
MTTTTFEDGPRREGVCIETSSTKSTKFGESKMTDKLYSIVGVALTPYGYKVRFANDMTRVKVLAKTDTDIELYNLPEPVTKAEAVKVLKTKKAYVDPSFKDSELVKESIDNAVLKYNAVRAKGKRVTAGPSMASLVERANATAALNAVAEVKEVTVDVTLEPVAE